jgi:hypothetical protein
VLSPLLEAEAELPPWPEVAASPAPEAVKAEPHPQAARPFRKAVEQAGSLPLPAEPQRPRKVAQSFLLPQEAAAEAAGLPLPQ